MTTPTTLSIITGPHKPPWVQKALFVQFIACWKDYFMNDVWHMPSFCKLFYFAFVRHKQYNTTLPYFCYLYSTWWQGILVQLKPSSALDHSSSSNLHKCTSISINPFILKWELFKMISHSLLKSTAKIVHFLLKVDKECISHCGYTYLE